MAKHISLRKSPHSQFQIAPPSIPYNPSPKEKRLLKQQAKLLLESVEKLQAARELKENNMADQDRDHNKTKEEILHEMKLKNEEKRQRVFVKDTLYPWLMAHSKSIDDAKNMLYAATVGVQQKFHQEVSKEQKRLSTVPLGDLKVEENILPDAQYDRDRELLALFKDEPVATAESLLAGMKRAIESFEKEASTKTPLKDLPAELLD